MFMSGPSAPLARLGATVLAPAPARAVIPSACASGAWAASRVATTQSPSATRRVRVAIACIARSSLLLRWAMVGGHPPRPGSISTPIVPVMPRITLSPRTWGGYVAQGVVHDGACDREQADGQAQGYGQQGAAQGPLC